MSTPLVTIAIPCFCAEATIARAIEGARRQEWANLEILVVDDCSTDNSIAIVADMATSEPRLRLVRHADNVGPGGTRNTLLANARGEFVVFFDDDDESLPSRVTSQVQRLVSYEEKARATLVACYASGEVHYPNGYVRPLPAIGSAGDVPMGTAVADYLLFYSRPRNLYFGSGVPTCALMARASTFAAVGGFDASLRRVEDVDFAVRLALAGGHFVGTSTKSLIQHSTEGNDKSPERNLEGETALAAKHADYLRSKRRYYYASHWPRLRYWHFKRNYPRLALELAGLLIRNPVAVARHFLSTGPRRLMHERRKNARAELGR